MKTTQKFILSCLMCILPACMATPELRLNAGGVEMSLTQQVPVTGLASLSPDGKHLLISDVVEDVAKLWDISIGAQVRKFQAKRSTLIGLPLPSYVVFTPDGKSALISEDNRLSIWEVSSGREVKVLDVTLEVNSLIALSADGHKLMVSSSKFNPFNPVINAELTLYDANSGQKIYSHNLRKEYHYYSIALSPDGKYALLGSGRRVAVELMDVSTGKIIKSFGRIDAWKGSTGSVAFSPDGQKAAFGGNDGQIKLWDPFSGTELMRIKAHSGTLSGGATVSFSPDGNYLLSSGLDGLVKIWDIASGSEIRRFKANSASSMLIVNYAAFSPDGKRIISVAPDASVRIWDASTGEEMAVLIGFKDGEWLTITSEGYYNASEKGAQYLKVKYADKDYSVDQFYDVFYRPDIVAAKLSGQDINGLISITMKDASKSPPPSVEFTTTPSDTKQSKVKVCYEARSAGGGIGEVRLFHNGKLVESDGYYKDMAKTGTGNMKLLALNSGSIYENMRSIRVQGTQEAAPVATGKAKGELFQDCKEVETVSGENEVSVTAFNSGNTVQSYMKTMKFNSNRKPEDPHLYILSIGIDKYKDSNITLKYAAKDATDIERKLLNQSATVYKPQNIHYELLTDNKASKGNIINKINELSRIIKPNDGFILFVAGHGVLLQNQYYMLTNDYNGTVNEGSMISSNEIVEMSKKIKSLSQLFIFDTCHAGGVDTIVSGLYDARMSVLAKKMGLHIYASANSIQEAQDGYQGNGLFTYTLLDGLNNRKEADKNNDSKISLVELGGYAKQTTAEISKKMNHNQTPLIINFGKDNPVYNLK